VFARASADDDISDDDEDDEDLTVPASPGTVVSAQPSPATFTRQRELKPVTKAGLNPSPRTQRLEKYALESLEMAAGGVNQIGTFLGFNPNPLIKRGGRVIPETADEIAEKAEKRAIAMQPYRSSAVFQLQQRRPTTTFKRSQNQEEEEDDNDEDDEIDGVDRLSRADTEEIEEEDLAGLT